MGRGLLPVLVGLRELRRGTLRGAADGEFPPPHQNLGWGKIQFFCVGAVLSFIVVNFFN